MLAGRSAARDLFAPPQHDQVGALSRRHLQRVGDRLQDRAGGTHVPALLQPGVPGGPPAGNVSPLLAPQPWGTSAPTAGQSDLLGRERFSPDPQELGEVCLPPSPVPAAPNLDCHSCHALSEVGRSRLRWWFLYQDNSLSSTCITIVAHLSGW